MVGQLAKEFNIGVALNFVCINKIIGLQSTQIN